jgi:hypothetical protein
MSFHDFELMDPWKEARYADLAVYSPSTVHFQTNLSSTVESVVGVMSCQICRYYPTSCILSTPCMSCAQRLPTRSSPTVSVLCRRLGTQS